jgi:hypothetical protein
MSPAKRPAHERFITFGNLIFDGKPHIGVGRAQVLSALLQDVGTAERVSRDVPHNLWRDDLVNHREVVLRPEFVKVAARDGFILFG